MTETFSPSLQALPASSTATATARNPATRKPRKKCAAPAGPWIAGATLALLVACAVWPGALAPFDPTDMDGSAILQAPGWPHILGTDNFGRDVFSLIVTGTRQSLLLGCCAVLLGGTVGGFLGLLAGYGGRVVDGALMRFLDIWMSIPDMLLAIVIAAGLGASFANVVLAVGLTAVPRYARVMRAQVIALRGRNYVEAARAIGASPVRVLLYHVAPHTVPAMLVITTLGVASAILTGAGLSFIGLGVIDDRPDWGFLLSQGRAYLTVAWWFATFPGLAITTLVLSINVLGNALRPRLDPQGPSARQ